MHQRDWNYGTVKAVIQAKLAIKGQDKPAYIGDVIFL